MSDTQSELAAAREQQRGELSSVRAAPTGGGRSLEGWRVLRTSRRERTVFVARVRGRAADANMRRRCRRIGPRGVVQIV